MGTYLPQGIEKVLLRLATPHEYRSDMAGHRAVVEHLNQVLSLEGLGLIVDGVQPSLHWPAPASVSGHVLGYPSRSSPDESSGALCNKIASLRGFTPLFCCAAAADAPTTGPTPDARSEAPED
jgi:hypothetical protein